MSPADISLLVFAFYIPETKASDFGKTTHWFQVF